MGSIVVITHNGRMPRDGGKRIAYQVGDFYYDIASGQTLSLRVMRAVADAARQAEVVASRPKSVDEGVLFDELPVILGIYCTFCNGTTYPDFAQTRDLGPVRVRKCDDCGRIFRRS